MIATPATANTNSVPAVAPIKMNSPVTRLLRASLGSWSLVLAPVPGKFVLIFVMPPYLVVEYMVVVVIAFGAEDVGFLVSSVFISVKFVKDTVVPIVLFSDCFVVETTVWLKFVTEVEFSSGTLDVLYSGNVVVICMGRGNIETEN